MTPLKIFMVIQWRGRRHKLRAAVRRDPLWSGFLKRSWRQRRYWFQGQGHRRAYRGQALGLILEWRIGHK